MSTNFTEAIGKIIFWKNSKAFPAYTKLYIAGFSAFLSLPLIDRLKSFSGSEEISMVAVAILIYKYLLPKFNKDSLTVWTLIYGYLSLLLLILPPIGKSKSINTNGRTN